jgi:hypothetical protein
MKEWIEWIHRSKMMAFASLLSMFAFHIVAGSWCSRPSSVHFCCIFFIVPIITTTVVLDDDKFIFYSFSPSIIIMHSFGYSNKTHKQTNKQTNNHQHKKNNKSVFFIQNNHFVTITCYLGSLPSPYIYYIYIEKTKKKRTHIIQTNLVILALGGSSLTWERFTSRIQGILKNHLVITERSVFSERRITRQQEAFIEAFI